MIPSVLSLLGFGASNVTTAEQWVVVTSAGYVEPWQTTSGAEDEFSELIQGAGTTLIDFAIYSSDSGMFIHPFVYSETGVHSELWTIQ